MLFSNGLSRAPRCAPGDRAWRLAVSSALILFVFMATVPCYAGNSATSYGQNVSPTLYYNNDAMYTDMMLHSSDFFRNEGPTAPALVLTANGYPASGDAQLIIQFDGYPAGDYQFYGEGDFSISFQGFKQSLQRTNNITTGTVTLTDPAPGPVTAATTSSAALLIDLTVNDPKNPPTNFHLITPGYPAYPNNPTFGQPFLQALAPFTCIRMMDWMNTNGSQVSTWASRPQPNYWGCENQGQSYEKMIELANTACKDIWINVPLYATDDWSTNMANLLKSTLNPKLHVYYEFSNECWNWGFSQWSVVEGWDQTNSALTTTSAWERHGQEVAFLLMHHLQIMQPILGSQGRPILAGQFAGPAYYCGAGLAWIQQVYGPPANYVYGISGAPYFTGTGNETDVDSIFANIDNAWNGSIIPCFQQYQALCQQYNVKLTCYEAGQGLYDGNSIQPDVFLAAQNDPRMGAEYLKFATIAESFGTDVCNFYNFIGAWGRYGYWGALTDVREAASNPTVKYVAEVQIAQNGAPGCDCSGSSSNTSTNNSSHNTEANNSQKTNTWATQEAAKMAGKASPRQSTSPVAAPQSSKSMTKSMMQDWAAQLAAKNAAKAQAAGKQKKQ